MRNETKFYDKPHWEWDHMTLAYTAMCNVEMTEGSLQAFLVTCLLYVCLMPPNRLRHSGI